MNRPSRAAACLILAVLAEPAVAQDRPPERGESGAVGRGALRGYANPSAVIAAELALDRDAAARGEWTAMAAAAAPQAVLFTPRLRWAGEALKGRANPPATPRWEPHAVWSSCDGSVVVSRGDWRGAGGTAGWFTRVWQRQPDGSYKWLATSSGGAPASSGDEATPDMIAAAVADCPARPARDNDDDDRRKGKPKPAKPPKSRDLPPLDPLRHGGASADGSLRWEASVGAGGAEQLTAAWRKGGAEQVLPLDGAASSPLPNLR